MLSSLIHKDLVYWSGRLVKESGNKEWKTMPRKESAEKHDLREQFMSGTVPLIIQLNLHSNGFWQRIWKVFELPSQNSELNPYENLQNNLDTSSHYAPYPGWVSLSTSASQDGRKSQKSYVQNFCICWYPQWVDGGNHCQQNIDLGLEHHINSISVLYFQ